jgi:ribosomal protein S12 methylthiotransferase
VGYPGETDQEFQELVDFVKEARFDHLGVFAYSHEENTASYFLKEQLGTEVKEARRESLMKVQMDISKENLKHKLGQVVPVLVEGLSDESEFLLKGRNAGQAPDIDGYVLIRSGDLKIGTILPVKLERSMEYDFIGSAV